MSNALYNKGREGLLDDSIQLSSDDIRVALIASSYSFLATHQFLSDLGATINGRSSALTSKTFTDGVFDAADAMITTTAAVACNALVIFKHTGSDASARLLAYIDTAASGLPFTPAAAQSVPVVWDNGANKIFAI